MTAWRTVATQGDVAILVADSVTIFDQRAAGQVIVCGSHGGEIAALFAAATGATGVLLNDAGVGKDRAGVAGLQLVEPYGMAAAAVDYRSARIGDGQDTYESGIVSYINCGAAQAGVRVGMAAGEAAECLARWTAPKGAPRPATPRDRPPEVFCDTTPRVVGLDSASQVGLAFLGNIVVTGSHGGVVDGRAVKAAVGAAFFNDAGIGKDQAGIGRLRLLDRDSIPGVTVSHATARIGDARDAFEHGVVSYVNEAAALAGVCGGDLVRRAVEQLARALSTGQRRAGLTEPDDPEGE